MLEMRTDSGLAMRATAAQALAKGDAAEIFVRPESVHLAASAEALSQFDNRFAGNRDKHFVQRRRLACAGRR